jgi:DNA-binding MarR family transcriptional regulator
MTSHAPAAPCQKKGASSDSRDILLRPEETPMATREDHQATRDQSKRHIQAHDWSDGSSDFVLVQDVQPPPRIELARERMLMCRLYLGLIQTISDDYGAEFVAPSDSSTLRTVGIYVFLRTVMCSPVSAGKIAHALKLPRVTVLRRLQDLAKQGYVERVGNAYRVTDKVNIPDLQRKLQRRIDLIVDTAKRLSELGAST